MYDVIEQIELTLGVTLTPEQRREILSSVISVYNDGVKSVVGE